MLTPKVAEALPQHCHIFDAKGFCVHAIVYF